MAWTDERSDGEPDDRQLVATYLGRREEGAFRAIYRRHAPSLHRFIIRLAGKQNGDAEDIIQAVWIRALERLEGFRWESCLRTWLTGIALQCCRERRRVQRRCRDLGQAAAPPAEPRAAGGPLAGALDLRRAIDGLPEGYRVVLVLHDLEGYTHEEIGGLLDIDPGTSKSQLARARRAVRAALGEGNGARGARAGA
jgi:RNA polymerase sigma-70 factor (ECF subfamily)